MPHILLQIPTQQHVKITSLMSNRLYPNVREGEIYLHKMHRTVQGLIKAKAQ